MCINFKAIFMLLVLSRDELLSATVCRLCKINEKKNKRLRILEPWYNVSSDITDLSFLKYFKRRLKAIDIFRLM